MKIFAALRRLFHRSQPPAPVAPAPFDDGLVQLAQLIAVDDPTTRPGPDVVAAKRTAPKSPS